MNYPELVREIVRKSKYGKYPLTIGQTRNCLDLFQETVLNSLMDQEDIGIENFLKFEIKELKSHAIRNVSTGEIDITRDLKTPKVRYSRNFIKKIKDHINEE